MCMETTEVGGRPGECLSRKELLITGRATDTGAALFFNLLLSAGSPLSSPGARRQGSTAQFTLLSLLVSQVTACVTAARHKCSDQHCRGQLLRIERALPIWTDKRGMREWLAVVARAQTSHGLLLPITSTLYPPPHEKGCRGGLEGEASRATANLKAANICSTLEKQAFHT
ncbi:hypothetical protein NQZ68_008103 [Dissostichus eleginoides]|nr:hypothetical protein NQZ68_008103 [Dissostichus eleginoides]